jgi:hypothetical protein
MLFRTFLLVFTVCAGLWHVPAHAAKRVALVIGNGAYEHATRLQNPANDATDIAAALKRLDFEIIDGRDLGTEKFDAAVQAFTTKAVGADIALFYYSGHGLQFDGANYLVPVDARIDSVTALKRRAVIAQDVVDQMERGAKASLVFLDACRNNTLTRDLAQLLPEQSRNTTQNRGLARMNANGNSLIAFAAAPNDVAADGTGSRNSPFTAAVLKHIETPNIVVPEMLTEVTADVVHATSNRQKPEVLSRLVTQVRLKVAAAVVPLPVAVPPPPLPGASRERDASIAWEALKASCDRRALDLFGNRYDDTFFGDMARKRLASIDTKAICQSQPPTPARVNPPPGEVDDPVFIRKLQAELTRVGCLTGLIDGNWSAASKAALRDFSVRSSLPAKADEPTSETLKQVAAKTERVCPLSCRSGEVVKDGRCTAAPKAEQPKPETPSVSVFNGGWAITWNGPDCFYKTGQGRIQVSNGIISGNWSGRIAADGSFSMSVMANGSQVKMGGRLSGRSGSGKFAHGGCSGTIGAAKF